MHVKYVYLQEYPTFSVGYNSNGVIGMFYRLPTATLATTDYEIRIVKTVAAETKAIFHRLRDN
jgi:hypothetical protein